MTSNLFEHVPHPHIHTRRANGPVKTGDIPAGAGRATRFNTRLANRITGVVGTMWCFYVFNLLASLSARAAFSSGDLVTIVGWVSSNWIQLILLPALMVGQNLAARAADARSEATYNDAEAVLHEAMQIQAHLAAQDAALTALVEHLGQQDQALSSLVGVVPHVKAAMAAVGAITTDLTPGPGEGTAPA